MNTPGPKRTLSTQRCQTCPALLSLSQVAHGMKRCKPCRQADPRRVERQPQTPVRQHSTAESVWLGVEQADFTARMTLHFAALRPGIGYFNARDSKERVAGSKRSLRSVPL